MGLKRKKVLTPNSKASRKKNKTKEDEILEDSIKKVARMSVSPKKPVLFPSLEDEGQEEDVNSKEEQDGNEKGSWCHEDELEKLSYKDIGNVVNDIYNVIFALFPKYDVAIHDAAITRKWDMVCPEHSCPVRADVRKFDFKGLAKFVNEKKKRKFDIIMMDPPWMLTTANPTRGVSIAYPCLRDTSLINIPTAELQTDGFLLIWVINSKMALALKMFDQWGYKIVDSIDWLKMTVNRRIASGHGYYLQHAFETCLIGLKGNIPPGYNGGYDVPDVIYSLRRGQSQKPEEIYEYCEKMVKNGLYLEIFGRRHNCRDGWITIGNQI